MPLVNINHYRGFILTITTRIFIIEQKKLLSMDRHPYFSLWMEQIKPLWRIVRGHRTAAIVLFAGRKLSRVENIYSACDDENSVRVNWSGSSGTRGFGMISRGLRRMLLDCPCEGGLPILGFLMGMKMRVLTRLETLISPGTNFGEQTNVAPAERFLLPNPLDTHCK